MYALDILSNLPDARMRNILDECSAFVDSGVPLYKYIPALRSDISRIKVRHVKQVSSLTSEAFKAAFGTSRTSVIERSVIATTTLPADVTGWCQIFPPNGYHALVSTVSTDIDGLTRTLAEDLGLSDTIEVTSSVIASSYVHGNITPDVTNVVLYDLPHFYAIRLR